jgi:hypothetical protein
MEPELILKKSYKKTGMICLFTGIVFFLLGFILSWLFCMVGFVMSGVGIILYLTN